MTAGDQQLDQLAAFKLKGRSKGSLVQLAQRAQIMGHHRTHANIGGVLQSERTRMAMQRRDPLGALKAGALQGRHEPQSGAVSSQMGRAALTQPFLQRLQHRLESIIGAPAVDNGRATQIGPVGAVERNTDEAP